MNVTITRLKQDGSFDPNQGRPGVLTIEASPYSCKTLEAPWRDNKPMISSVPANSPYPGAVVDTNDPRLVPQAYELSGVDNRDHILLHNGNWAGDKSLGYRSDVEGCTLLGDSFGELDPGEGYRGPQLAVLNSRATVDAFMAATYGAPIVVTYVDAA